MPLAVEWTVGRSRRARNRGPEIGADDHGDSRARGIDGAFGSSSLPRRTARRSDDRLGTHADCLRSAVQRPRVVSPRTPVVAVGDLMVVADPYSERQLAWNCRTKDRSAVALRILDGAGRSAFEGCSHMFQDRVGRSTSPIGYLVR